MAKEILPPEPLYGRLCLVTPAEVDLARFAPELDAALGAGDVASLFICTADPAERLAVAERLVPIAQANDVATIVANDLALLDGSHADGVHVAGGLADLRHAVERLHPGRIVGAGGIRSRHDAMTLAETECDYLFFGRFDGDTEDGIFPKSLDLAAWWSAVFEIPAIVMGGRSLGSVIEAVDARIEFVALRSAVWDHPDGAAAAVAEASRRIAARQAEVAS